MALGIRVTSRPTFRDIRHQKFEKANQNLLENKRNMMRGLGRRFVAIAQGEAPEKTGKFKKGIRFRTYQRGDNIGFTTSTPQPLGKWIIEGTKPHEIVPKGPGYPLRFYWEKVGKVVYTYRVWHPGTQPNPFMERAKDRWLPEAQHELNRISTRWAVDFTS